MTEQQGFMKEKTLILMDNASSHLVKNEMESLDSYGVCVVLFLHTHQSLLL